MFCIKFCMNMVHGLLDNDTQVVVNFGMVFTCSRLLMKAFKKMHLEHVDVLQLRFLHVGLQLF